jgi:hypothetical protein
MHIDALHNVLKILLGIADQINQINEMITNLVFV